MRRDRDDEGFVAVAFAGLVLVLVSIAVVVTALAAVAVARHRAATAADLAALAGAVHVIDGTACEVAGQIARAQGAAVESCAVEGQDVLVTAAVRPAGRLGEIGTARARARAGPGSGTEPASGTS